MNKTITNIVKYLLFLGIGVFLAWWSLHQIPDQEMVKFKSALVHAHFGLLVPVFFILTLSHLLRALRWRMLIEPMGYKPSLANTFFAVMVGYLANLAFPRLGEVLKCTILGKYEKIPPQKIVGTIVSERAFDVVCLGFIFMMALFLQFDIVKASLHLVKERASQNKGEQNNTKLLILSITMAIIIVGAIWVTAKKKWALIYEKIKSIISGIWEGVSTAWKLKSKRLFLFYSASIWILYILGTWVGLYATDGSGLGVKEAITCLAFASIGMIITPGGIGAYAFLLAKVLEENGVDYAIGIANGTLQWFAQFLIVVIVGSICLGLLPWYNKKNLTNETN